MFTSISLVAAMREGCRVVNRIMTVMITDDSATFRRLLRTVLEGSAKIVAEAETGVEAVWLYELHQPDWVLMDVRLAGGDGLTATGQILAAHPGARIVVVSHYDDEQTRAAAARAGATAFVSKENVAVIPDLLRDPPAKPNAPLEL